MKSAYILIPVKPTLNAELIGKAMRLAERMMLACMVELPMTLVWDTELSPSLADDSTPWAHVARARNRMLRSLDLSRHEWIIWIDADLVEYPANLPLLLIEGARLYANDGICAPTVLIEGTNQFYDTSAFIGMDGRNVNAEPPYYGSEASDYAVEMTGVGTVYACNRSVYASSPLAHSESHMHTDHFPICQRARALHRRVIALPGVVVYHADLGGGKYAGEHWHY